MKKLYLTLLMGTGCWSAAQARDWYVSSGVNSNGVAAGVDDTNPNNPNRGTLATPFKTIGFAATLALAGETVYVRQGTYANTGTAGSVFTISNSGSAVTNGAITYRYYPGEARPLLQFNTYTGISVANGVKYIVIDGFRIQGNNPAITSVINGGNTSYALNQPRSCNTHAGAADPIFNGVGISIGSNGATTFANHITVRNCDIYDCGQAGITAIEADYITIDNNKVFNNSWYTVYGSSGISVLTSRGDGSISPTGYNFTITRNKVFGNELRVPWYNQSDNTCKGFTDGNGIIIDTNTQYSYTGRTLIANNLVVDNGGAGITAFQSDKVDIINNTTYHNSKTTTNDAGEIVVAYSHDVLLQNNIVAASATKFTSTYKYSGAIVLNANLFSSGKGSNLVNNDGSYTNNTPLYNDPLFQAAGTNLTTADFHLKPGSPAINSGLNSKLSASDLDGNPRLVGPDPDRGAYESNVVARQALASSADAPAAITATLEAYPNPFTANTILRYTTARSGLVRLEILDGLGRRVALLVDAEVPAGTHEAVFATALLRGLYHGRLTTPTGTRALNIVRAE
ncbi:right-handed parallel beta-helix repeat-containing protein [Hymenobacter terricola]|uniref:right-handed parallel beta-helix repeat-containing protein n=1 Tax=Hymenobacter terricola TaxID=2819236 RepID=UPI001B311D0D|nr:right-handed parallel beta-helix repeat-containing protein [Hymenobacter terricola]